MAARGRLLAAMVVLLMSTCSGQARAAVATDSQQLPYQEVPGRLILKMNAEYVSAMDTTSHGLRYTRPAGGHGAGLYTITDGKTVHQKIEEMADNPAFDFVEPDYRVPVNWVPNDSLFSVQWHHATIQSPLAWNATTGSPEVKVCHIDSGVQTDHPDLAGRVAMGWNMVPEVQDFDNDRPLPDSPQYRNINDSFGHGTHTAGIIAAVGNNMLGVAGVAMNVRLLVCRFIWDDGFGSISDALECLRLCKEEGASISSNSWGGVPRSKAIEQSLKEIEEAGMLFVLAAGNQAENLDSNPTFPASSGMPNVLVVGSSEANDALSDFSNWGQDTVHLLAPGRAVLSTTYNGWYGPMDGTSMACPVVAGAAALLQSAALGQGVQLSYSDMKSLLLAAVDPSPGDTADKTISGGRLNIGSAMAALAVLLHERGTGELPGGWLEGDDAEQMQQRMLQNPWGQGLLAEEAGASKLAPADSEGPSAAEPPPPAQAKRTQVQSFAAAPAVASTEGRQRRKRRMHPGSGQPH